MLEQAMVTLVYSGVPEEAQTVPGVRVCGPHHTRYDSAHCLPALYVLMVAEELEEHPSGLDEETARKHVFQVIRAINFCHQNQVSNHQHCTKHLHSKLRSKWPLQIRIIICYYEQWVRVAALLRRAHDIHQFVSAWCGAVGEYPGINTGAKMSRCCN